MEKHKNIVIVALVLLLGFLIYLNFKKQDAPTHSELFELRQKCLNKAEEFAEKNIIVDAERKVFTYWKVLHSDYNIDQKSCFGEFDRKSSFVNSNNLREGTYTYYIYDLLADKEISKLVYKLDNEDYFPNSSSNLSDLPNEYYKIRKQIFGLNKDK